LNKEWLQQTEYMKNKKNGFAPIIILILLVLIAGGAYYFGITKNKTASNPIVSIKPSSNPIVNPTVDPTANWKTYRGKIFQYKYPDNLYLVDLNYNDSADLFANKESADTSADCIKNKLGTPQKSCPGSLIQIMINSADAQTASQTASTTGDVKFSLSTNPQGLQMSKNEEAIGGMGKSLVFTAFVVKNPTIYTITVQTTPTGYWQSLYPNDTKTDNEIISAESALLNQILSTFKFTDNGTPDIPLPISSFFAEINKNFSLNLAPVAENQFYSPSGMITKKSWKLDFTNTTVGKSLTSFLLTKLSPNNEGGSIGGGGTDGYENGLIKCSHSYGYRSGDPTNWSDPFNYLSCAEK
jgi:hypothetical protein